MKFVGWVRAIRGRELRMYERLFARSFLGLLPPILLPSLSAASTKRLIRSLLPRPAFILDFPRRRLDRGTRLLRHYFVASLARRGRLRFAGANELLFPFLPSFLPSAHKLPPVRPCAARPSVPIAPAPPHVLPQLSFVRRSRPSVRPSPARSLARYCRRAEWLPVSVQSHCSPIS